MRTRVEAPSSPSEALRLLATDRAAAVKTALLTEIRARGISQRQLARQLGYGWSYLANLFGTIKGRDPAHLRIDTMFALLALLDIEPLEFLARVLGALPTTGSEAGPDGEGLNPAVLELKRVAVQAKSARDLEKVEVQQVLDAALEVIADWTRVLTEGPTSKQASDEG